MHNREYYFILWNFTTILYECTLYIHSCFVDHNTELLLSLQRRCLEDCFTKLHVSDTFLSVQQEVLVDMASLHFLHCVILCFVSLYISIIKPFLFTKYAQCLKSSALWMGLWLNMYDEFQMVYSMQHNLPAVSCCIIPNPLYTRQLHYSSNFHTFNSGYGYKVTAHIEKNIDHYGSYEISESRLTIHSIPVTYWAKLSITCSCTVIMYYEMTVLVLSRGTCLTNFYYLEHCTILWYVFINFNALHCTSRFCTLWH